MIENDLQYRVTQEQAARLEAGLLGMIASQPAVKGISPVLLEGAKSDVRHLLVKLYGEIAVYEAEQGGNCRAVKRLPIWLRRTGWRAPSTSPQADENNGLERRPTANDGSTTPNHNRAPALVDAAPSRAIPTVGKASSAAALIRVLENAEASLQTTVPGEAVRRQVEKTLARVGVLPPDGRRQVYAALGEWAEVVRSLIDEESG